MPPRTDKVQFSVDRERGLVRVEQPVRGGWYVCSTFAVHDDTLELVEVRILPGGRRERFYRWDADPQRDLTEIVPFPNPGEWAGSAWAGNRPPMRAHQHRAWQKGAAADFEGVEPGGISTRLLRDVRVSDLIDQARFIWTDAAESESRLAQFSATLSEMPIGRPGGSGRDDRSYLPWAVGYDERVRAGSRSPIKDLAQATGRTREQVRDMIHEVRRRGLLPQGVRGRAAGLLTSKGKALAEEGAQA